MPALIVDAQKDPCGYDHDDCIDDADHGTLVESAFAGDQDCVENRPYDGPDHEEAEHDLAGGAAAVAGIGADDVAKVGEARKHRDYGRHAEPPQRTWHQDRDNFAFGGGVEFFLEWDIDQIEEIEEADPGNAGEEMDPACDHQEIRIEIGRNVNAGTEQRCRDVKHESSSLKGKGGLYISGRVSTAADLRERILSRDLQKRNLKSRRDLLELVPPGAARNLVL